MDCITGYNVIEAESMDEAEKLAQTNPFISSIRIYELRSMQTTAFHKCALWSV